MAVGDAYVFPGFLTPVLTQLFFPKPPTTFLTCFCRGERRKYAGKKSRLNRGSNSQPPGLESDTLSTEPPGRGSNNETLAQSKLKAFANDIINVSEKMKFVFGRVENILGKRRKCWLPAFSPFPKMFSETVFPGVVKSVDCVVMS